MKTMKLEVSEELLVGMVPTMVYWLYSGAYMLLSGPLQNYRLHPKKDEDDKNLVSKGAVIKGVLLQQAIQFVVNTILSNVTGSRDVSASDGEQSLISLAIQFFTAMVVIDAYQYFAHRWMHENKFVYRHIHSQHHQLVVPYAFGAFYTHPLEGILFGLVGGPLCILISGMSSRTCAFFFSFTAIKAIEDHCGFLLPWNPLHHIFENNPAFHDSHHQLNGFKYNYSPGFFVIWDRILGTYKPNSLEKKAGGASEAKT